MAPAKYTPLVAKDESESGFKKCADYCTMCCGCCCGCLVLLLILVVMVMTNAFGIRNLPIGPNTLALGYGVDMIGLLFTTGVPGYASAWCGGNSLENLASCNSKTDYPGPGVTSFMSWDEVWKQGSELPAKEWSGEWWRGNELGFIINNPKFWSKSGINPMSITLGVTPKQHAAVRPIMESMWTIGEKGSDSYVRAEGIVKRRIGEFLKKDTFTIPADTTALVHQILMEFGLKQNVSWEDAQDFVTLQSKVVKLGTVSSLIPGFLSDLVLGSTVDQVNGYIDKYVPIMESLFGEKLKDEDCSPSLNCSVQAASATWDALYAAGGLSVPGAINTGLGVLYSSSSDSNCGESSDWDKELYYDKGKFNPAPCVTYDKDEALQFFWENIRFFPPVVGFPHWTTRPTCADSSADETAKLNKTDGKTEACKLGGNTIAGYPAVNAYMGGVRDVPNLALAMSDARKWGNDSNVFRIRPLSDYGNNSVGFAEMAVDKDVAGGRMNRVCPGKYLSLLMGGTFFEEFDRRHWTTTDIVGWKSSTPFVGGFTLTSKP